jgi:putative hydrolase of the HAD superfamily
VVVRTVVFDLDDTLYPQAVFLDQAWDFVAYEGARRFGLRSAALRAALDEIAVQGSDRGWIIDRAIASLGVDEAFAPPLVAAFRSFSPVWLPRYPGVDDALRSASRLFRLGLLTDGNPAQQRAKLRATGLAHYFEAVVYNDEEGRDARKPSQRGFLRLLRALESDPSDTVMIGDRPSKDIAGAASVGMRAIRVRQGEYMTAPDDAKPWHSAESTPQAVQILLSEMGAALT